MKNRKVHILMLIVVLSGITAFSNAQSIVGSWKKTDEVLTEKNGKTSNTFKMIAKRMPCYANIVYIFSAGGKMDERAKDCAAFLQKEVMVGLKNSRWSMTGNKLIMEMSSTAYPVSRAEYKVEFVGSNKMIWTFDYAQNKEFEKITKAEQMKTTYERSMD
jgi:hypothetical protein